MGFYKGKKVFITGNTGFKGTWLSYLLLSAGAEICGYSHKRGKMFELCHVDKQYETCFADIRSHEKLEAAIKRFKPDIVIHMAAQPLVIDGYKNPRETFDVNVMGTVNLMNALKESANLGSMINITTDKVYKNRGLNRGYCEEDELGGIDPYSCSKSCSELVTYSFNESFKHNYRLATARAGNVIGGGDFAENRIIPDCLKAAEAGQMIEIRNPDAVRPWQHVLEPLNGYLTLAKALYENQTNAFTFNFGPEAKDCIPVKELASLFCHTWGHGSQWKLAENLHSTTGAKANKAEPFKECELLILDSSKAKEMLKWANVWAVEEAVEKTIEWHKAFISQKEGSAETITLKQIEEYNKRIGN